MAIDISGIFQDRSACFCGSGQTYHNCHKKKIYRNFHEVTTDQYRFLHESQTCLVSEDGVPCVEQAIASHSIQKNGSLRAICKDSHVYGFSTGPNAKGTSVSSELSFKKIPIARASTVPALCPRHDFLLFRNLESGLIPIGFGSSLELAIRCQLYEAIASSRNSIFLEWLCTVPTFDFSFNRESLLPERENFLHYAGYSWVLLNRLKKRKDKKSIFPFFFFSATLNRALPFTSAGSFCIETDFLGRKLQKFNAFGKKFNFAQFSILPLSNGQTHISISSLGDKNPKVSQKLIHSISVQPQNELADCTLKLAITHSENTYFSPDFIDSISESNRSELLERFDDSTAAEVGQEKPEDALSRPLSFSIASDLVNRKFYIG